MSNYYESNHSTHFIEVANGADEFEVKGYGQICGEVKTTGGEMIDICVKNVYHVSELKESLLSLTTATKKHGCTFVQAPEISYLQLPSGTKFHSRKMVED